MAQNPLDERIAATHRRLQALRQRTGSAAHEPGELEAALEELANTLEVLHVTTDQLHEQNDELAAAGQLIAAERQHYQERFDLAPDGYLVSDAHGVIREANSAAAMLLHRRRKYLVSKPLTVFVDRAEHRTFRDQLSRLQSGAVDRLDEFETRVALHDGSRMEVALTVTSLRQADGQLACLLWLVRDITARKRGEAQLRQSQRLEALGRLVGGVAHEFNNQLTVVRGSLDLMLRRISLDAQARGHAERIRNAISQSVQLVQQLLTFSRPQRLELSPLNLSELVRDMTPMLHLLLGEHITLQVQASPDLWLVRANRGQMEQALMNLLSNARDAMAPADGPVLGDTVTVQTANLDAEEFARHLVSGAEPGAYVHLAVSDNGPGMPPEVREHVFEPFFTTKEVGKGTGLGLSTVFGIIKQHEGYVDCTSQPGYGTSFHIYLPRSTGSLSVLQQPTVPGLMDKPHSARRTIVVVEDDEGVRDVTEKLLQSEGFRVYGAATADAALALLPTLGHSVDLVVTDVVMPGISGLDLAQRLLRIHPTIKILLLSGYPPDTLDLTDLPGARFLTKPFELDALLRTVRELLES